MDAETWIGIGIAAAVGAAFLRAWYLNEKKPKVIEPEHDPNSQYSPTGAQIMRNLEQARREWTGR